MDCSDQKLAPRLVVFTLALFTSAFLYAPRSVAQQPGRTSTPASTTERQIRRSEQIESALQIADLEKSGRRVSSEERTHRSSAQIKEDFLQIQTVNNKMMQESFSSRALDYKRISEATLEIQKRASRLKTNLPLPPLKKGKQAEEPVKGLPELEQGELKPALLALDDLIQRFVTNPVFQQSQVVDIQQSSKALRDLEEIIKLSEKISKSTDKLVKASTP